MMQQPFMQESHITGPDGTSALCLIKHLPKNTVLCEIKPETLHGKTLATINLQPDGSWEISRWFNNITDDSTQPVKSHGWGQLTLCALAEYLINTTGRPGSVSYVWNGQSPQVGILITEKWHGICRTPLSVLKYDCADSPDNHIYDLDVTAFFEWLSQKKGNHIT